MTTVPAGALDTGAAAAAGVAGSLDRWQAPRASSAPIIDMTDNPRIVHLSC